jgi:hypothetical protein
LDRASKDPRVIFVSSGGALLEKLAINTDYTLATYGPEANYAKTKVSYFFNSQFIR